MPFTSLPRNKRDAQLRPMLAPRRRSPRRAGRSLRRSLGTSMPTVVLPGIGATMRTLGTARAMARSSARPATFETRRPASSSISNWVMTGPVSIWTTRTLQPNSSSVSPGAGALVDLRLVLLDGEDRRGRAARGEGFDTGLIPRVAARADAAGVRVDRRDRETTRRSRGGSGPDEGPARVYPFLIVLDEHETRRRSHRERVAGLPRAWSRRSIRGGATGRGGRRE